MKNKIVSNGTLLDKHRIDVISKYIDTLTLSIDSIDNDINAKIGRGKNHFGQIGNIIQHIHAKYPRIKLKINTVACSLNKGSLPDLAEYVNNQKLNGWRIFRIMPMREKAIKNYDKLAISKQEFDNIKNEISKIVKIDNLDFREMSDMEDKYVLLVANGDIICTENGKDIKKGNASILDINTVSKGRAR
jgi:radical S-adenosyl methionine domain-containing protein 2